MAIRLEARIRRAARVSGPSYLIGHLGKLDKLDLLDH